MLIETETLRSIGALAPGFEPDLGPHDIQSRIAEGVIPFGRGVVSGSADQSAVIPADDTGTFVGIARANKTLNPYGNRLEYTADQMVPVLREGRMVVEAVGTVAADAPAYVVPATGKFSAASAGNIATGGTFLTSGTDTSVIVQL